MGNKALFGVLVGELVRGVSRLHRDEVCCGDLTSQQFETLRKVEAAGQVNLTAMAAALGIDPSTASRNLARLQRHGYLSKTRHGVDARSIVVELTRKGRTALSTLSCDERDVFAELYERIPPPERATVIASLSVLTDALGSDAAAGCCPPDPKRKLAM